MKPLFALSAVVLFGLPALARDLYVSPAGSDSNPGTQAAPFRTIHKAAGAVSPGTVVHVAPGNYSGDIRTNTSGSAAAPIRFVSDAKWGAKINSGGGTDTGWDNRGDYVSIEGFEVDGTRVKTWRFGIYSAGSHSLVQGNKVHDIQTDPAQAAVSGSSGGAGIGGDNWYGDTDIHLIGNVVYKIGPPGARSSLIHGMYQVAAGTVANNIVYDTAGVGIHLWHDAHDIKIMNNTIYKARDGGIMVGSGDSGIGGGGLSSSAGDFVTVANNIVVGSTWGITEYGGTGVHNKYVNNLVWDNSSTNIRLQNGLSHSGTIVADPKFVNAGAADFRIQSGSPAIDKGTSSFMPSKDFNGAPRSQGGGVDVGAFELGELNSTPNPNAGTAPAMNGRSLMVQHSGMCVDVAGAATGDDIKVLQWPCQAKGNQKFEILDLGKGQYSFKAEHSGKCLDIRGASTSDGAPLIQYACHGGANQRFGLKDMGGGYYSLVSMKSGKCLDVAGASSSKGARLIQWPCHGRANQLFHIN